MQAFSQEIRECYKLVDHCARRAELAHDPNEKADFLEMQNRWLLLAHSHEFLQRFFRIT